MSKKSVIMDAIYNKINDQIDLIKNSESYKRLIKETADHILDDTDSWDMYQKYLEAEKKKNNLEIQLEIARKEFLTIGATLSLRIWEDEYGCRSTDITRYLESKAEKQIENLGHPIAKKLAALNDLYRNAPLQLALATTSKQMSEAFESILDQIGITKEDLFR